MTLNLTAQNVNGNELLAISHNLMVLFTPRADDIDEEERDDSPNREK